MLDELHDIEGAWPNRQADERRIPHRPDLTGLIGLAVGIHRILEAVGSRRWALRHCAEYQRPGVAPAHHVHLIVEDEEVAGSSALGVRGRLEDRNGVDVEKAPEHFVHGDERGRHASR